MHLLREPFEAPYIMAMLMTMKERYLKAHVLITGEHDLVWESDRNYTEKERRLRAYAKALCPEETEGI